MWGNDGGLGPRFHIFHRDVCQLPLLIHIVNRDDAAMGKKIGRARLAKEAFAQSLG
jgi:hypothetical protein